MANIVSEYWEVDGVSLHTWAWAIETLSGRDGVPGRRGDNVALAYRPGALWVPKALEPRQLSLALWVKGSDADGVIPGAGARAQFRQNLEALKALFGVTERELVLTRRIQTLSTLLVQTGKAECVGTLDPNMRGNTLAGLVVDLLMADPFWYGAQVAPAVPLAGATIVNAGNVRARWMTVVFTGPFTTQVTLTNQTLNSWLKYTGTVAGGETITIDTSTGAAVSSVAGNVQDKISHSGTVGLLEFVPGNNAMLLAAGGGSGNAVITYKPPFL